MHRRVLRHIRRQSVAFIALFFALTGGALATAKYLQASDPITQGDLAGSTYGNPLIANGTITSAKFDGSAIAPNAAKLGGLDVRTETIEAPMVIGASRGAVAVVGCPPDRVPIHVVSIDAGPDVRVSEEHWGSLHSDLQVDLDNTGPQAESLNSVTVDCFGADGW